MKVTLESAWKSYESEWVFKNLDFQFTGGNTYAILGPNGSGKSTLLQVIAGNISLSKGNVSYNLNEAAIKVDDIYRYLGFSSPYQQLIEEFSLYEQVTFHNRFRQFVDGIAPMDVIARLGMEKDADKQVKNFSSGMKQRVKLALSILGESEMVLLDEPATNLDERGVRWFRELLDQYLNSRLLIVSANRPEEYQFCSQSINLMDFK